MPRATAYVRESLIASHITYGVRNNQRKPGLSVAAWRTCCPPHRRPCFEPAHGRVVEAPVIASPSTMCGVAFMRVTTRICKRLTVHCKRASLHVAMAICIPLNPQGTVVVSNTPQYTVLESHICRDMSVSNISQGISLESHICQNTVSEINKVLKSHIFQDMSVSNISKGPVLESHISSSNTVASYGIIHRVSIGLETIGRSNEGGPEVLYQTAPSERFTHKKGRQRYPAFPKAVIAADAMPDGISNVRSRC